MNSSVRTFLAVASLAIAAQASADVTFFEHEGFAGQSFSTGGPVGNLKRFGYNDRASSVIVTGERWKVCDDRRFRGRCVVLRPGEYPSLASMALSNRITSVQPIQRNARINENQYAPLPSLPPPDNAVAQIMFFQNEGFAGRSFTTDEQVGNLARHGFNDRASSVIATGERWEVCDDRRFRGRCVVLRPGRYPSLAAMGLNNRVSSVRQVRNAARIDENRYAPLPAAASGDNAGAEIMFFENEGFAGRSFSTDKRVANLARHGFNDRASSVVVLTNRWEVCEDSRFDGRCAVLRPGRYPSLAAMGLNDRVSSVREITNEARIDDARYAPPAAPIYDNRRRHNERLFEADVTSVRAVMGTPEQRCWVEQEQVAAQNSSANIPGAILGAVIGGVLGHQVGGGHGKDLATAGGAVAGGFLGANIGQGETLAQTRDVQRCADTPTASHPEYWDVTYNFRGQDHRIQMTNRPAATITVNERGEPRG